MKKKILLIDSCGALLSGISLLVVPQFENWLGIPRNLAYSLAPIPFIFCINSFLCYRYGNNKWKQLLFVVAVANLLYCLFTLLIASQKSSTITTAGVCYFIAESIVVGILSFTELRIATRRAG
ncbi:MAG: hypothetical protein JNM68_09550 [Dinghuibacter sp.]|nr:hypothetical protein [Dinghuibacter sp.]